MLGINEYIVVGSQSVLGAYPNAPDDLRVSMEADLIRNRFAGQLKGRSRRRPDLPPVPP